MKKLAFIVCFLFLGNIIAQKTMERIFDASEFSTIVINSDLIYHISIVSEKTNSIKIKAQIEGENYENVVLSLIKENNTLQINTSFTPFFELKNDKLAAHKAISIELELIVPERMEIHINAAIASVTASGKFKEISADLENGNCTLSNFKGNAMLKTKQGFITIYASKEVFGTAFSKKGMVINELSKKQSNNRKYKVEAESFNGDISLFQIH